MDLSCLCCSHVKIFIGDGPNSKRRKGRPAPVLRDQRISTGSIDSLQVAQAATKPALPAAGKRDVNPIGSPPTDNQRRLFMEPSGTAKKKYQELESQGGLFFVRSWLQTTRGGRRADMLLFCGGELSDGGNEAGCRSGLSTVTAVSQS